MTHHIDTKSLIDAIDWDFKKSKSESIHSIHPYPAKFIADIPRKLIQNLPIPTNTLVFDPFCGSGVTLCEAQNAGYNSMGVDLNPIACLISRVKSEHYNFDVFNQATELINKVKNKAQNPIIPNIPNLDHWFKREVQYPIANIIQAINKIDDPILKDALLFCISSIIVKVSNQDSDTRYAAVSNNISTSDVYNLFIQTSAKLKKAKLKSTPNFKPIVLNKNSLSLQDSDFPMKVGLVITSPPYPNAYEYWLYHKYRMWWLGFDPVKVKESEIGARAHYFKKNHQTHQDFVNQMDSLFKILHNNSAKGAYIVFIIGRSKIHGNIFENDSIIKTVGEMNGFHFEHVNERIINPHRKSFNPSHARIKQEFIVILKKNG